MNLIEFASGISAALTQPSWGTSNAMLNKYESTFVYAYRTYEATVVTCSGLCLVVQILRSGGTGSFSDPAMMVIPSYDVSFFMINDTENN